MEDLTIMKRLKLILITFFVISKLYAQNTILVFDDFSHNDKTPVEEVNKAAFHSQNPDATISMQIEDQDSPSSYLQLAYVIASTGSYCGLAYAVEDVINLRDYNYISLKVKKDTDQIFRIQFKTSTEQLFLSSEDYIQPYMENEWQTITIPTENIVIDLNSLTEIVIVFEHTISQINNSTFSDTVYLDEFVFGTTDPGEFLIDPMNDLVAENATGGQTGIFTEKEEYVGDYSILYNNILTINFDNNNQDYGGVYFLFGHDANEPYPVTNYYDFLEITLSAPLSQNPGNIKLELKNTSQTGSYRLTNIESDTFRTYKVPLSDFTNLPDHFLSFNIVFEKNKNDRVAGQLLLKDIRLVSDSYIDTDSIDQKVLVMHDFKYIVPPEFLISEKGPVFLQFDSISKLILEKVEMFLLTGSESELLERKYMNEPLGFALPALLEPSSSIYFKASYYNGYTKKLPEFKVIPFDTDKVLLDAFKFMDAARNDQSGMYIDALFLNGDLPYHPYSTGATAMSLLALVCEAELNKLSEDISTSGIRTEEIEYQILQTLRTVCGKNPGYYPQRTDNGFLYHWMAQEGDSLIQTWSSEVSTIDMALLVNAALFARNYFEGNSAINSLAYELIIDTDFSMALDTYNKKIYRELNYPDGTPKPESLSTLFNEYYLVLELAAMREKLMAQRDEGYTPNQELMDMFDFYQETENYPKVAYEGYELLTDQPGFISHFIYQFVFYLSHSYSTSDAYIQYFNNAFLADSVLFSKQGSDYHGLGAGVTMQGEYEASTISNNDNLLFNPSQLIGYMPVVENKASVTDQVQHLIWEGKFIDSPYGIILPRQSAHPDYQDWVSVELALVDYVTTIFGFISNQLGTEFFSTYNNYDYEDWVFVEEVVPYTSGKPILIYPNPTHQEITIESSSDISDLKVINASGQVLGIHQIRSGMPIKIAFKESGIYLLEYINDEDVFTEKVIVY